MYSLMLFASSISLTSSSLLGSHLHVQGQGPMSHLRHVCHMQLATIFLYNDWHSSDVTIILAAITVPITILLVPYLCWVGLGIWDNFFFFKRSAWCEIIPMTFPWSPGQQLKVLATKLPQLFLDLCKGLLIHVFHFVHELAAYFKLFSHYMQF